MLPTASACQSDVPDISLRRIFHLREHIRHGYLIFLCKFSHFCRQRHIFYLGRDWDYWNPENFHLFSHVDEGVKSWILFNYLFKFCVPLKLSQCLWQAKDLQCIYDFAVGFESKRYFMLIALTLISWEIGSRLGMWYRSGDICRWERDRKSVSRISELRSKESFTSLISDSPGLKMEK